MAAWLTFIKERFPLPIYAILCGGFAYTGMKITHDHGLAPSLGAFLIILIFFFLLRTMDELKDHQKDIVANPSRPLPRGLLKPEQLAKVIKYLWLGTLFIALVALRHSPLATLCFLLFWVYLWLMYKEFYIGTRLQSYPLIYAVSHQVILVPICVFAVCIHIGDPWNQHALERFSDPLVVSGFLYGLIVMGSFFGYEIARKLDPGAHPLLKTYLQTYGPPMTFLLIAGTQFFSSIWVGWLGSGIMVLGLAEIIFVVASLSILFAPQKYKLVEAAASLSLAFHIWLGVNL